MEQLGTAEEFGQFEEQEFQKDAGGTCRGFLGQFDGCKGGGPGEGICGEHVTKELGNVSDSVGFEAVNVSIDGAETDQKRIRPDGIDFGEALAKQAVEFKVGTLLAAALNQHICKLGFEASGEGYFEEFVAAFLEIDT